MQQWCQFQVPVRLLIAVTLSVVSYGHTLFSSKSEFPENVFSIECQYQTDRFCTLKKKKKISSFLAFLSVEQVQD